ALSLAACRKEGPPPPAGLADSLDFSRPASEQQIDRGLYAVENQGWRWTARQFAFRLGTPARAPFGAVFKLALVVPAPVIAELKEATLTCTANGATLPPESWRAPGEYVLSCGLP